jgi:uncharacterized protein DUF4913
MTSPQPNNQPADPTHAGWDAELEPFIQNGNGAAHNTDPAATAAAPATPPGELDDAEDSAPPLFPSLEAWVTSWLTQMITVEIGPGLRWCTQWWQHPMAIARLESIWRAWEEARISEDPTAMSVWWRDHADPHLDHLMESPRGPFRQCSGQPDGHRDDLQPLPVEQAPPGWFG